MLPPAVRPPTRALPWLERAPDAMIWRWRLAASAPLAVERTVDVAQAIVAALNETARAMWGLARLPPDLHAGPLPPRDEEGRERHEHAFYLPEDLDQDGVLDHVAVALHPALGGEGFTRQGLALLAACPRFWLGEADVALQPWSLAERCPFGLDRAATEWASMTPFAPPLMRGEPDWQIARSLERVGAPPPLAIERLAVETAPGGRRLPARAFVPTGPGRRRWEDRPALEAHRREMAYWRIVFGEPVAGPLSLGGLCHFGLGRFAPVDGA